MIKRFPQSSKFFSKIPSNKSWKFENIITRSLDLSIREGIRVDGTFYPTNSVYHSVYEPLNSDGTYKRVIYQSEKNFFYTNSPAVIYSKNFSDKTKLQIDSNITSVTIPKKYWGEQILPNTVKILDYSNGQVPLEIMDDGNMNLILSSSIGVGELFKINPSIDVPRTDKKIDGIFKDSSGKEISKKRAMELYENGEEVYFTKTSEELSTNYLKKNYDPINERFGSHIKASGDYLLATLPMDEKSFSFDKNGKVSLYKKENSNKYIPVKIFNSPFSQNSISKEDSIFSLIKTEYGDFLLDLKTFDLCITGGYSGIIPMKDDYGYSADINGDFCAVSSLYQSECKYKCDTGSGLVFCYYKNKGGPENWGLTNVLEGLNPEDRFGHSISIYEDIMAIGAPGFSGSGAVFIYRRKRYDSPDCDGIPSAADYGVANLTDWTGSLLAGTGSTGNFALMSALYKNAIWKPLSSVCFTHVTSDVLEPIIDEVNPNLEGNFFGDEFIVDDSQKTTSNKIFTDYSIVPPFVSGDYTWVIEKLIVGPENTDSFGACIDLWKNVLVIGNSSTSNNSNAWVYSCTSSMFANCPVYDWSLEKELSLSDGDVLEYLPPEVIIKNSFSGFGNSVCIDDNIICVGSPFERVYDQKNIGSVLVYKRGNHTDICGTSSFDIYPIQKIHPFEYKNTDCLFGYSCELLDGELLIGGPSKKSLVENIITPVIGNKLLLENYDSEGMIINEDEIYGKAFYYTFDNFKEKFLKNVELSNAKIKNYPYKMYGASVAINNTDLFVGAPVYSTVDTSSIHYNNSIFLNQNFLNDTSSWVGGINKNIEGTVFQYLIDKNTFGNVTHLGNIFYPNGKIIITNTSSLFQNIFKGVGNFGFSLGYTSENTIYQNEYMVQVSPGEFNRSTNPSSKLNKKIPYDINLDGIFDMNDFLIIFKYFNGESFYEDFEEVESVLSSEQEYSNWKIDNLMSEGEDAILVKTILKNNNTSNSILTRSRFNYIKDELIPNGLLDINGDEKTTLSDINILFRYMTGRLTPDILESSYSEDFEGTKKYLEEVLEFMKMMTGKVSPYQNVPTLNSSGQLISPYSINNGGIIDPKFFEYINSSSLDSSGSYLSTYITSVGLYTGGELVALAKLSQPIKNLINYPLNISIKFDTF